MDRPSQEPETPPGGAESPPSSPVETPSTAGPEPGVPQAEPLRFPAEASRPELPFGGAVEPFEPAEPLRFPVEASRPESPLEAAAEPFQRAEPSRFPPQAPRLEVSPLTGEPSPVQPATQLPYPVAHIPGTGSAPPTEPPPPRPATTTTAAPSFFRFAPPALAVVAALLTALGVFLPLFLIQEPLGGGDRAIDGRVFITETAWGHIFELPGQEATEQAGSPLGLPLLFGAALLAVAGAVALLRPDRPLGRWLIAAGAVFGAGVVFTVATSGIGWGAVPDETGVEVTVGPGMWLTAAGAVAAAAGAVLAHLPRRPGWADPAVAYADTPTPPSGVAITVLPPDEEADEHPGPPLR
ncbi:hypothetical protein [Amycolatopsis sp. cmx-4-61]|uniref:hypothetical protein n=1 Tax=Amycolatopsis sp. cmx-4-61 TaxID=2790937 RepID=UPI00397D60F7